MWPDISTLLTGCIRYFQQNTGNVVNLLDAMRVHNVNKFIYSSTCATYGDHDEMPITEETVQVVSLPRCPDMSAFGSAGKPIIFPVLVLPSVSCSISTLYAQIVLQRHFNVKE